jgi:hypothetical protein
MNVPLTVKSGGEAAIVENQGDHVTVRSSVPSPPGSTLALLYEDQAIVVKVRGCKRLDEVALPFRIEGRFVSLTRATRERLFGLG